MILVSFILQTVLVAGIGRLMDNKVRDVITPNYRAVIRALERTYPLELRLPPGTLDTNESLTIFLCNRENALEMEQMMSEFDELDFTGMGLRRLPVYGMLQMTNLKKLVLDDNRGLRISRGEIEVISKLPIEEVSMRSSNMSFETFKALQGLPKLAKLDVSRNRSLRTYTDSDNFGDFAMGLVELNVSKCDLGSGWLGDIFRCTNLRSLNVSGCSDLFEGRVPTTGCSFMGGLTSLNVSRCAISNHWLDDILKCTGLIDLKMSHNDSIGVDPTKFSKFESLKSLKRLSMKECNLTTANLNEICKCGGLEELSIGENRRLWADNDEVDFGTCRESLRVLKAARTGLGERGLEALCGFPNTASHGNSIRMMMERSGFPKLAILDISWNGTLGPVISQRNFSFGRLENTLTELNMASIGITSSNAVKAISGCERLLKLNVSFNKNIWRYGSDTIDFGWLKSRLQVLDVELTDLPPAILSEILRFDQLVGLNISRNRAAGRSLGCNEVEIGGVKDTLRKIDIVGTDITREGLQWIFNEFNGLKEVDAMFNRLIKADDLKSLDFAMLRDRLVELTISADSKTLADLRRKLPLTRICCNRKLNK